MADKSEKTAVLIRVDTKIKEQFTAAYTFIGISKDEAVEQAMKLFTDKHIKKAGNNEAD